MEENGTMANQCANETYIGLIYHDINFEYRGCNTSCEGNSSDCALILDWDQVFMLDSKRAYSELPVIIFMILMQVMGTVGNLIVIVVYVFKKKRSMANNFVLSLSVLDFSSCVVIHPYIINKLFYFYNVIESVCRIFEFLVHLSLCLQASLLMVIAVDRNFAVYRPFESHTALRRNLWLMASLGGMGVVSSVPILIFYGYKTITLQVQQGVHLNVRVCHFSDAYDGSVPQMIFAAYMFMAFLLYIFTISTVYTMMSYRLFKRRRQIGPRLVQSHSTSAQQSSVTDPHQITAIKVRPPPAMAAAGEPKPSCSTQVVTCDQGEDRSQAMDTIEQGLNLKQVRFHPNTVEVSSTRLQGAATNSSVRSAVVTRKKWDRHTRASFMLFLVTAVFIVSWLPFWVTKIYGIGHPSDAWATLDFSAFTSLMNHMFYANNSVNPFIYTFLSKSFITDLKRTWRRMRRIN